MCAPCAAAIILVSIALGMSAVVGVIFASSWTVAAGIAAVYIPLAILFAGMAITAKKDD